MHEVSIMQSVFELAFERMQQARATQIHRVRIRIGALTGVVPEALQFAFDALKKETPAAGATLDVEYLPVRLHCLECSREFGGDDVAGLCPTCGQPSTTVRQGRELDLVSLELSREE